MRCNLVRLIESCRWNSRHAPITPHIRSSARRQIKLQYIDARFALKRLFFSRASKRIRLGGGVASSLRRGVLANGDVTENGRPIQLGARLNIKKGQIDNLRPFR